MRRFWILLPLLAGWVAPAAAGTEAVLACLDIQAPDARLACYDRAAAELRKQPPALPPQAVRAPEIPAATAQAQFGAERTEAARKAREAEQIDSIKAAIKASRELQPGRYIVVLDNGQVWYVKEGKPVRMKAGDPVTVERGVLGSYALILDKSRTNLRAERVE